MALWCGYKRLTHFYVAFNLFLMIQGANRFSVNYFKASFEQFKVEAVKKPTGNARTSTVLTAHFNICPFMVVFSSQHSLGENEWGLKG